MARMSDTELLAFLDTAVNDAVIYSGEYMRKQEKQLEYYKGDLFGDEVEGRSKAVKTDVADVVDSDMVALSRVILGARCPVRFRPEGITQEEIDLAEKKTKYVDDLIRHKSGGYLKLFNWMKAAGIYDAAVVKYFIEEREEAERHEWEGINVEDLQAFLDDLDEGEVKITESSDPDEDGLFDVKLSVVNKTKELVIHPVPPESFLLSRNCEHYKDAQIIGDIDTSKTRGDLIAEGYDMEKVARLPGISTESQDQSSLKQIRFDSEGGVIIDDYQQFANERVEIKNIFPLIDYNGDGIAERRNIIYSGNVVLSNESFGHAPYAMLSSYPMPYKAIGDSRTAKVMETQRINSVLLRQGLDNLYRVNNPKTFISPSVDQDELLSSEFGGYVTVDDEDGVIPANASYPLVTAPVYDGVLTMMQWMDQSRAQTTGSLMANQGLEVDAMADETATRYKGVERASAGKVELLARTYIETGIKDLYEGVAFMMSRYQDSGMESYANGKKIKFRMSDWKSGNLCEAESGLSMGDKDSALSSLTSLYSIQQQLKGSGSLLVDDVDVYNTLDRVIKVMDLPSTDEFFNNPQIPLEVVQAENEILRQQLQELQQVAQQNPLQQAEETKAQAMLVKAQSDNEIKLMQAQASQQQFIMKMQNDNQQAMAKLAADMKKHNEDVALKLTELDMTHGDDAGNDAGATMAQHIDVSKLSTQQIIEALDNVG